jgi:cell division protein FtsB
MSVVQKAKKRITKAGEVTPPLSATEVNWFRAGRMAPVSWLSLALLLCAVAVVIGAEWPRLSERLGAEARLKRERARRKSQLRVLRSETDEFAASVERDLDQLPTIEDFDRRN